MPSLTRRVSEPHIMKKPRGIRPEASFYGKLPIQLRSGPALDDLSRELGAVADIAVVVGLGGADEGRQGTRRTDQTQGTRGGLTHHRTGIAGERRGQRLDGRLRL